MEADCEILLSILTNSNDSIYVFNLDETYGIVNDTFASLFNLNKDEIVGKTPYDLFTKNEAEIRLEIFRKVFKSGTPDKTEVTFLDSNNTERHYQIVTTPIKDSNGIVTSTVSVSRDITEETRIKKELLSEKCFSDMIIDSIPGLLYIYDDEGNMIKHNKYYTLITGYSHEEIMKMKAMDWYDDETECEKVKVAIDKVFRDGFAEVDAQIKTKSGELLWMHFNGSRLEIDGKKYFVGVGVNITERINSEKALMNYVNSINHDLRSPLGTIIGSANIIVEEGISPQELSQFSKNIVLKAEEMLELMNNHLLFTKIRNGQVDLNTKPLSVLSLLKKIKELLLNFNNKTQVILRNLDNELTEPDFLSQEVSINLSLIKSTLINLVKNAIEASANSDTKVLINIYNDNGLNICISNSGKVPEEILGKLFNEFATSKKKGSGIGLFSAKRIANAHGGDLIYQSITDGTRFILKLPFKNTETK